MENVEQPGPSQLRPNSFIDEAARILLEKFLKILKDFNASNDHVYRFQGNFSGEERGIVSRLCDTMGLGFDISGSGDDRIIYVYKTEGEVSNQIRNVMSRKRKLSKKPDPNQYRKSIVDELNRIWISQIVEIFLASSDEVYSFENNLSSEERCKVYKFCQKMGFVYTLTWHGIKPIESIHKTKEEVDSTTLLESLHHIVVSKESDKVDMLKKSCEKVELEPLQHEDYIVIEPKRLQFSRILKNFLSSKDEVYNFEHELSFKERDLVHQLSKDMGLNCTFFWRGINCKAFVHKTKKEVDTTKVLESLPYDTTTKLKNLPHFTFSEKSKQVLGGLLMHYPPGDEFWGEIIGTNSDSTDRTEQKEDDFFGRPDMSKADVTKQLEDTAARMKNPSALKPIIDKRSMLPIASFKDVIISTVESHQVVIICGETGCGKTTQVPQYILDHMWSKGEVCKIVCTQPRRISAISVSERISHERGETIGSNVGYKIRLESIGGRQSSIVLCTTGVLLKVLVSKGSWWSKTQSVKDDISSITHIIMDEIHERDRYSDLLLAIFREMLPSNPHLRLILLSATIDPARFSQYFGDCPVIHVPGFTYQVKTYYLEDILSMVKSGEDNNLDNNHELSQEQKLSLDEAINLAWSNDEWRPLLEFIRFEGSPKVFNYQHSLTGLNPLMVFAGKGKVNDMCMLLSLGANCHLRAKDGTTALEIAEERNQQVAAELLKKHMDNDLSNKEGKKLLDKYLATVNPTLIDVFLIEQLIRKICTDSKDGGILVFLPGLVEINRTHERLLASPFFNDNAKFWVISLHSMVPSIEPMKVCMSPPHGCRKIVLSTNIAETAVTIDDIVYVIDTGRVKENSYPYNSVLTVQSTWVSKASAKQREGRAGRYQPGICYHLYAKVQAESLLDFQVPEIKRMPIEELCLQVKLLDPSCKIEELLNRTLDPPGFDSIQNAIAVLQKIGALSFDEKLTPLGEKLGSLPVHPSTSRMLLFSILMNCLDPALTLACASEYEDPFMVPILPDEKKRAVAARSELASLYGGCGDQFAVIAAFECWQNSMRMGLEVQFCSQYFVSQSVMHKLSGMRKKLAAELFQNGLIHDVVSNYCSNAHDPGILHAVLVAWMYPMVAKLCLPNESRKKVIVKTLSCDIVCLNSHSTNFKLSSQKSFDCSLVVYDEITHDDWGMSIRNCTVVGLLPLLLLCREIVVVPAKNCKGGDKFMPSPDDIVGVIIDQWLEFESTAHDISHLNYLRERLSAAILYKVAHSLDVLPPILGAATDTLACVLSCDGLSGIPQTSDGDDTPTTTVNAGNLGKPATGTKQVGENPERSRAEIMDQDAPENNPSEAIKNPNEQTSQNATTGRCIKKLAVGWTFPETGWIKANVDGSFKDDFRATCAGVFRDAMGSWCFGFTRNLGPYFSSVMSLSDECRAGCDNKCYTLMAELWGILTALNLAREKGISQLWIESDSLHAVEHVSNRESWNRSPYAPIIQSIVELMRGNWTVRISHGFREGNKVADWLANYAHTRLGLHVLNVPPRRCIMLLTEDVAGLYKRRKDRATEHISLTNVDIFNEDIK